MYRLAFIIVAILAVVLGLLIGTLNPRVVPIDLLWVQFRWPLGLSLICALAAGIVLGILLCWLFSVLPLRVQLRRKRRDDRGTESLPAGPNG